jgi:Transposase, Mutator family
VATGDPAGQVMNIGPTTEQLSLVIRGLAEIIRAMSLSEGQEDVLTAAESAAVADVTAEHPTAAGVRRFLDWIRDCVQQGASAPVAAAVTALSTGILHDAEQLATALTP